MKKLKTTIFEDPLVYATAQATLETVVQVVDERIKLYDRLPPPGATNEIIAAFVVGASRLTELRTIREELVAMQAALAREVKEADAA